MNLERYKTKVGIAQLTHIIEEIGDDGLLSLIVEKLSEGTKPSDVARDLHLPFQVLWNWLEADPKRQRMYNHGWEIYAQDIHAETIQIADECSLEEVPLARLRIDTRFKAASNYDKRRFGAKDVPDTRGFAGGITINIGSVDTPQMAQRVVEVLPQAAEEAAT
jgi:hypothetical protein